jgi:hypothetical protein
LGTVCVNNLTKTDYFVRNTWQALTLHCMNFKKHDKKKFNQIKYIQKHNKYYTKITILTIFRFLMKICICIAYDTAWLLSTVTLYGYVSHMIQHVYWQPLSAPIAVYHICYSAAVERQNHSLKKYMEICVLYHIWYRVEWRVNFERDCTCTEIYVSSK